MGTDCAGNRQQITISNIREDISNMDNKVKTWRDFSWDYRAARVLQIANKIDIFTTLSNKKMSSGQLAQKCRTKPDLTERLLIACAAMGLLNKRGNRYSNTELSKTYLVRGQKLYQGDIIAHSSATWNFWNSLADEIWQEPAPGDKKADVHRNFIMGMHNIAVAGRADVFIKNINLVIYLVK